MKFLIRNLSVEEGGDDSKIVNFIETDKFYAERRELLPK